MNVLSVFDGMSCGQIALERAGIKVDNYFASEIDKYAMKVTMAHYPKTVQLGDILNWRSWDLPKIDLLIGGSPCQGFSNAGLGLNFEDPRSKLFFVYVDILKALKEKNPDLQFLLENVKMKKEWQKIITDLLGVEPVLINSALVSAQNRQRLYWANWKVEQPEDKGIFLKDIIEHGDVDRDKSYTIDANYFKGGNPRSYFEDGRRQLVFKHQSHKRAMVKVQGAPIQVASLYPSGGMAGRIYSPEGKSPTLRPTTGGGNKEPKISLDELRYRKLTPLECERLQTVEDNWTNMVSNTQRYKMLGNGWTIDVVAHILSRLETSDFFDLQGEMKMNKATILGRRLDKNGHRQDYDKSVPITQCLEVRATNLTKSGCLTTVEKDNVLTPLPVGRHPDVFGRRLPFRYYTLREYCLLQTVPEDYFSGIISDSKAKALLGNGFTIDVIVHILNSNLNLR